MADFAVREVQLDIKQSREYICRCTRGLRASAVVKVVEDVDEENSCLVGLSEECEREGATIDIALLLFDTFDSFSQWIDLVTIGSI